MKLYELTENYNELYNLIDVAEEEDIPEDALIDTLEAIEESIDEKLDNISCLYKNLIASADAIKQEEKKLADRRKSYEKQADRLKRYVADMMQSIEKPKFESARNKISFRKSEAVEIKDESIFVAWAKENAENLLSFKEPTVNKTEIKKALKEGDETLAEYAAIITNQNLQIK